MTAMASTLIMDRYRYINTLRAAGVDETLASAHAQGLSEALQDAVATKADLTTLQTHMDARFVAVDTKFDQLKSHLDLKLAQIDTKFAEAKADTRTLAIAVLIPLYALAIGGLWTTVQALRQPTAPVAISPTVKP
jgi:hypothetical protein